MIKLAVVLALAACGSSTTTPAKTTPSAASAPLSLAADARMIEIPAGRFVSGSTTEERTAAYDDFMASAGHDGARTHHWFDHEDDRHVEELPTFKIDLMPVTQAQFEEYVIAGKAPPPMIDEATWAAQGFTQDYASEVARFVWKDGRPPMGREDHPVVLVTWDEAAGYCAWRGRRLPTALEFEKASRGRDGLAYPWGNIFEPKRLDSSIGNPRDTMPAGSYASGASPFGVLDMAGNVFQWTSSPAPEDPTKKLVKGSAWDDYAGVGRAASGHGRAPAIRHAIVGFRCAG